MTRAEREAQLIGIAEEVLVERGYGGTTVDEIADRAGITKPVIYDHFGSKDGLIGRVITRAHAELEAATVAGYQDLADPTDARALVKQTQLVWFTFIDHHRDSYAILREEGGQSRGKVEKIRVKQGDLVIEAFRQTRQFADTDARELSLMATMLVALSERYAIWRLDKPDITVEQAAEDVTRMFWSGFGPR